MGLTIRKKHLWKKLLKLKLRKSSRGQKSPSRKKHLKRHRSCKKTGSHAVEDRIKKKQQRISRNPRRNLRSRKKNHLNKGLNQNKSLHRKRKVLKNRSRKRPFKMKQKKWNK